MYYGAETLLELRASVKTHRKSDTTCRRILDGRLRRAVDCDACGMGTERPPPPIPKRKKTRRKRRGSSQTQRRKTARESRLAPGPKGSRELRRGRRAATLRETCYEVINMQRSLIRKKGFDPSGGKILKGELGVLAQLSDASSARDATVDFNLRFATKLRTIYLGFMFRSWAWAARANKEETPQVVERVWVECPCQKNRREDGIHAAGCSLSGYRDRVRDRSREREPPVDPRVDGLRRRGAIREAPGKHKRCPGCFQRLVHYDHCKKKDKLKLPYS